MKMMKLIEIKEPIICLVNIKLRFLLLLIQIN